MLPQLKVFDYNQGLAVDLGPTVYPAYFHVTDSEGAFICSVRGLVLEGSMLAYNPNSNEVEWIPVRGTSSDLSQAEERSACALANLIPHTIGEEEQLKSGRCGETEGSPVDTSMDDVCEEESCNMKVEEGPASEDDREEIDTDDEDEGTREGGNSPGSSESG